MSMRYFVHNEFVEPYRMLEGIIAQWHSSVEFYVSRVEIDDED